MTSRFAPALLFLLAPLSAQEHASPLSFPAHGSNPTLSIGAEYLGHGVPTPQGAYIAKDYLVVGVGVFPSARVSISNTNFTLRVDGELLPARSPSLVATSINTSDWHGAGHSNHPADIALGGAPLSQSPLEESQNQSRSPRAPGIGDQPLSAQKPDRSANQAVAADALPNVTSAEPVRGLLYFHYAPKTKSGPRSVELIYDAGTGAKLTIRLL
jgi:hypothetical protein